MVTGGLREHVVSHTMPACAFGSLLKSERNGTAPAALFKRGCDSMVSSGRSQAKAQAVAPFWMFSRAYKVTSRPSRHE